MDYAVEYIQRAAGNLSNHCDTEEYENINNCMYKKTVMNVFWLGGSLFTMINEFQDDSTEVPIETHTISDRVDQISQRPTVQRSNILKNPVTFDKENKSKLRYYVVYREKENVNLLAGEFLVFSS